jgi:hypothetical protein
MNVLEMVRKRIVLKPFIFFTHCCEVVSVNLLRSFVPALIAHLFEEHFLFAACTVSPDYGLYSDCRLL